MNSRLSLILILLLSCSHRDDFDLQGHRGAVGLFPENSIIGFIETVKLGVTTLEMDVVITKDNKVLVSHEPWISNKKCIDIRGNDISDDILTENIYTMNFDEIKNFMKKYGKAVIKPIYGNGGEGIQKISNNISKTIS